MERMTKRRFEKIHRHDPCWLSALFGRYVPSEETAHLVEGSKRCEGYYARLTRKLHRTNKWLSIHGCYGKQVREILMREFLKRYPDMREKLKKDDNEMWLKIGGASL